MPSPTVLGTDHSLFWSAFLGKLGSARTFTGLGLDFGHMTLCKRQCGRDNYDNSMAVGARDLEKNAEVTFLPGCQEGAHLLTLWLPGLSLGKLSSAVRAPLQLCVAD